MTTTHYEFHYHVNTTTMPDWWLPIAGERACMTVEDALYLGRPFIELGGAWRLVRVTTISEIVKESGQ